MRFFLLAISYLLLICYHTVGQNSFCDTLQQLQAYSYDFKLSALEDEASRDSVTAGIDKFWTAAKSHKADAPHCLRQMIATSNNSFFIVNAGKLLLSLDTSRASFEVLARSIERVDPNEAQVSGYTLLLLVLSQRGFDIGKPTLRYMGLQDGSFTAWGHFYTFNRSMASAFLFATMPPATAERYLRQGLTSPDTLVVRLTLNLLLEQGTEQSFQLLDSLRKAQAIPAVMIERLTLQPLSTKLTERLAQPQLLTRTEVLSLLQQIPRYGYSSVLNEANKRAKPKPKNTTDSTVSDFTEALLRVSFYGFAGTDERWINAAATLLPEDIPALYDARRRSITNFSDEAYGEYQALTGLIYTVIIQHNLYAQYRPD